MGKIRPVVHAKERNLKTPKKFVFLHIRSSSVIRPDELVRIILIIPLYFSHLNYIILHENRSICFSTGPAAKLQNLLRPWVKLCPHHTLPPPLPPPLPTTHDHWHSFRTRNKSEICDKEIIVEANVAVSEAYPGQVAPRARNTFGAPMFEHKVFWEQMHWTEKGTCNIAGISRQRPVIRSPG